MFFCFALQRTTAGLNDMTIWWVPSLWHGVTPPLKNPDYAPDNALELANQSSRYIGCKHKAYNNTFYSGFVFCEKFITIYKHNWDNNGRKAATGWRTHEHPAGWKPEEDSHMKRSRMLVRKIWVKVLKEETNLA